MKLSVIMPAYNQARYIYNNIQQVLNVLSGSGFSFEIIVVSDGSRDRTYEEAIKHALTPHVKVYQYDRNLGKGYALRYGFRQSHGQYVVFIDGDMDLHPKVIHHFMELIKINGLDVVVGSKRHPDSIVDYPPIRRFYSACYQGLIRVLFGLKVRDTQVGLKLFKREVLEKVMPRLVVKRYAFDVELLAVAHQLGFTKIMEAPVILQYQFSGTGMNWMEIIRTVYDTFGIFYRLRIQGFYGHAEKAYSHLQLERPTTS